MSKSLHFNTFGGNPMASAVGSTVLDVSIETIYSDEHTCTYTSDQVKVEITIWMHGYLYTIVRSCDLIM